MKSFELYIIVCKLMIRYINGFPIISINPDEAISIFEFSRYFNNLEYPKVLKILYSILSSSGDIYGI